MRGFSGGFQHRAIVAGDDVVVLPDDSALPAAVHLTGPDAADVLAAAVEGFGGRLATCAAREVHYRPERDLVVRYDAEVSWRGGPGRHETLLASTTRAGTHAGVVPVEAVDAATGTTLSVGVWRWPFDPMLPGLAGAVAPASAERRVTGVLDGPLRVTVRAYRPTERAVIELTGASSARCFLKVVPPAGVDELVARHETLIAAGIPAPRVLAASTELGVVALEALDGLTLREQLTERPGPLPTPAAFVELSAALARCEPPHAASVRSRASAALGHARLLRAIDPALTSRLDALTCAFADLAKRSAQRVGPVIHGDLYDAQLVTAGATITGLLDVDDVGPGDPIDDQATLLGFLTARSTFIDGDPAAIDAYGAELRHAFIDAGTAETELDLTTAAVLVGLATGPFRSQHRGWRSHIERHLERAEALVAASGCGIAA